MNYSARDASSDLLYVNFNQDSSSLCVGTKAGYKLMSIEKDAVKPIFVSKDKTEQLIRVERLYSSALVAYVDYHSPRKLRVYHSKRGQEICNYSYCNTVLSIKLNRDILVVCLEETIFMHNLIDMKVLHTIRDTPPNPHGIIALSCPKTVSESIIAYPGSNQTGEVQIYDVNNLRAVTMISAHENPLAALAFNVNATKLATASEKGTVIRVFSIPKGDRLFEFRRGLKRCALINSLSFCPDSLYLCSSSNTETVHIFKLSDTEPTTEKGSATGTEAGGLFDNVMKWSSSYLPTQVSGVLNQGRAFAVARLSFTGTRNISSVAYIPAHAPDRQLYLMVIGEDGYLYIYDFDKNEGGECTLVKQHKLSSTPEDTGDASLGSNGTALPRSNGDELLPPSLTSPKSSPEVNPTESADKGYVPVDEEEPTVGASEAVDNLRLDDEEEFPRMS